MLSQREEIKVKIKRERRKSILTGKVESWEALRLRNEFLLKMNLLHRVVQIIVNTLKGQRLN